MCCCFWCSVLPFSPRSLAFPRYVTSCVGHMGKGGPAKRSRLSSFLGGKRKGASPSETSGQYFGSFKYSAAKLKEKGVLISVDGVSDSKLKLVKIEVSSDEVGVFIFKVCRKRGGRSVGASALVNNENGVHVFRVIDRVSLSIAVCLVHGKLSYPSQQQPPPPTRLRMSSPAGSRTRRTSCSSKIYSRCSTRMCRP